MIVSSNVAAVTTSKVNPNPASSCSRSCLARSSPATTPISSFLTDATHLASRLNRAGNHGMQHVHFHTAQAQKLPFRMRNVPHEEPFPQILRLHVRPNHLDHFLLTRSIL